MMTEHYFLLFALGTACRDLVYFYFFADCIHPISYSAVHVTIILLCSVIGIGIQRAVRGPALSLPQKRDYLAVVLLGFFATYIYTFYWVIGLVTPGIFNMLDYGLTPFLTVLAGVMLLKERLPLGKAAAFLFYILGLGLLLGVGLVEIKIVLLCATYPLATVISDFLAKHLMKRNTYWDESRILIARFIIACPLLIVAALSLSTNESFEVLFFAALSSVLLGYIPLFYLVRGLREGQLVKLAQFELLIPLLTLLGSLPVLYRDLGPVSYMGLLLMIVAIFAQRSRRML